MAGDVVPESRDDGGQDVLPCLHLDGQDGQAHAELDPDGLGAGGELFQEEQDLAAQRRQVALRDLGGEVVCDLGTSVSELLEEAAVHVYLALEGRRGKELRLGLGRALQDGYRRRPRIFLLTVSGGPGTARLGRAG